MPGPTESARAVASGNTLERFLWHARVRPHAPAVQDESGELGYAALLSAVRERAGRLAADGARRGSRVAVESGYGTGYIVALLATWLLEAVAVPLDPSSPADRRRHQVRAARCDVAAAGPGSDGVVERAVAEVTAETAAATGDARKAGGVGNTGDAERAVAVEDAGNTRDTEEARSTKDGQDPAAYILFTSGSTGVPKGVEVEHPALVNMLEHFVRALDLGPGHRLLAHSNIVFDMSVPEMLMPLISGGTVAVAPPRSARNPEFFAGWLRAHPVDAAWATPSQLRLLLPFLRGERVFGTLISGGEALTAALADDLRDVTGTLWNAYGPTEITVVGLAGEVVPPHRDPMPIGRPLTGLRAHVLDEWLRPVPDGEVGELFLSGIGVARGYVGDPELTARAFVTGPGGERMYRTGDLVRVGPDGRHSFHGRRDDQVKIRGHRVELGEIEAVAHQAPSVSQAVAVVSDVPHDRPDLYLAVATEPGSGVGEAELRAPLRRLLPPYMQPRRVLFFDELPRNTAGKTDRLVVRRMVDERLSADRDTRPPTPVEGRAT
ncbi:amino acid adenylation domain-containing protein [Streptosporangium sp. DT93]|uniref:amino acid adenylation domain-containing protein n=1 Tax=Streptosporangium sp. DT93 TaxID=3393428 RepID=UPI003CFA394B